MGLKDFISNIAETKEQHRDRELRSRYYKTNFTKAKEQIERYCKKNNIDIKHVDEAHREMFLQTNRYHMIVSIVQLSPRETAIDVKVQTYKVMGMNKPKMLIFSLYQFLNQNLEFKGSGLHPN